MREITYGDLIFINVPKKDTKKSEKKLLKDISSFYRIHYMSNIKKYRSILKKDSRNNEQYYIVDYKHVHHLNENELGNVQLPEEEVKEKIYGKFYFRNGNNPKIRDIVNVLRKYESQLDEISEAVDFIKVKMIRNKKYYDIQDKSPEEIMGILKLNGFKEEGTLPTPKEMKNNNVSDKHTTQVDKDISSANYISTGSMKPIVKPEPVYLKPKKSKSVSGNLTPERKQINSVITQRNQTVVQYIKTMYNHTCQICGEQIQVGLEEYMSEAHHIKPLGSKHSGADVLGNLIVVCPNHHVMFDRGAITIDLEKRIVQHVNENHPINNQSILMKHKIEQQYIDYHNIHIYKG